MQLISSNPLFSNPSNDSIAFESHVGLNANPIVASGQPEPHDIPEILGLIENSPYDCAPMDYDEVWDQLQNFWVIRNEMGTIVATASTRFVDYALAELRGMTVASAWRGKGLASILIKKIIKEKCEEGTSLACVTKIPEFFERFGFKISDNLCLPDKIRKPKACHRSRITMLLAHGPKLLVQEEKK